MTRSLNCFRGGSNARTSLTKSALLGATPRSAKIKDTCPEQINRLGDNQSDNNRWWKETIPDLIISALFLWNLVNGAHTRFGGATALGDIRALAPGQA